MNKNEPALTGLQTRSAETMPVEVAVRDTVRLLDAFLPQPRRFDIRLWDGRVLPGDGAEKPFTMVLNHPGALRAMFTPPIELSMGEAYIYGDFDLEGDLLEAISLMEDIFDQPKDAATIVGLLPTLLRLPRSTAANQPHRGPARLRGRKHSVERDREAVQYHYDVSNAFYALWLGRRMLYSCAYFETAADDLDAAQEHKLEHICRKVLLQPGERLLDIGCGWGGLAIYAAQNFGVRVTGITLSKEQFGLARERVAQAGLDDRIEIRLQDYREIEDAGFDKITSVGMVEHVGRQNLPEYFAQAYRILKPGGLFLNHGISSRLPRTLRARQTAGVEEVRPGPLQRWIERDLLGVGQFQQHYFFPDGELEAVSDMNLFAEKAGFEVRDVEDLREHYALTLEHWVNNMAKNRDEMVRQTNLATYRTWRLYMSAAAFGFRTGRSSIHQSLLAKPDHGRAGLPLTREWMYTR